MGQNRRKCTFKNENENWVCIGFLGGFTIVWLFQGYKSYDFVHMIMNVYKPEMITHHWGKTSLLSRDGYCKHFPNNKLEYCAYSEITLFPGFSFFLARFTCTQKQQ